MQLRTKFTEAGIRQDKLEQEAIDTESLISRYIFLFEIMFAYDLLNKTSDAVYYQSKGKKQVSFHCKIRLN